MERTLYFKPVAFGWLDARYSLISFENILTNKISLISLFPTFVRYYCRISQVFSRICNVSDEIYLISIGVLGIQKR